MGRQRDPPSQGDPGQLFSPHSLAPPPWMSAPEGHSPVHGLGGFSWEVPCLVAKTMRTGPDHLGWSWALPSLPVHVAVPKPFFHL